MTVTAIAGQATTLAARFESVGTAADPELPLLLTIVPVAGGDPIVSTSTVDHPAVGSFTYSWTPPAVTEGTDYLVTWDPSGDDTAASEIVTVLPAVSGSWATVGQGLAFTGKTMTTEHLTLASSVITLYAGVTPDMPDDSITTRDRYWLAMATSFQAAWMPNRPGYLEHRETHTSQSADGVSIQREAPSDAMLAPLAARTLKNLSWIGTRSTYVGPAQPGPKGSFMSEAADQYHAWTPRPI